MWPCSKEKPAALTTTIQFCFSVQTETEFAPLTRSRARSLSPMHTFRLRETNVNQSNSEGNIFFLFLSRCVFFFCSFRVRFFFCCNVMCQMCCAISSFSYTFTYIDVYKIQYKYFSCVDSVRIARVPKAKYYYLRWWMENPTGKRKCARAKRFRLSILLSRCCFMQHAHRDIHSLTHTHTKRSR